MQLETARRAPGLHALVPGETRFRVKLAGGAKPTRPAFQWLAAKCHLWASDVTFLATGEGWRSATLDLANRRIEGWSLPDQMPNDLV